MSKRERDKGKRGEIEVAKILDGRRTGGLQSDRKGGADVAIEIPGYHVEVKRQERIDLMAWIRQAETEAAAGETPVVAFRKSHQPWRVVVPIEWFAEAIEAMR